MPGETKRQFQRGRLAGLVVAMALGLLAAMAPSVARAADQPPVLVFAAASLKNALDEVIAAYRREGGVAHASYAASSALARQIEQGAPADLFVSADLDWMDYLDGKGLIAPGTRTNLLRNEIVLIAPKGEGPAAMAVGPGLDLLGLLGDGRLAVADARAVPAGKYAKAALEHLGAWDGVKDRLAQAENVRAALALVSRGEASAGIVYRTDAMADSGVRVVGRFPAGSHPPIVYPAALTKESHSPGAAAFLAFLKSGTAKAVFERHGFEVGPAAGS